MVDGLTGETGDNAALLVDSMHSKSARAAVPILLHHSVGCNATEKAKKQDTVVAMLALSMEGGVCLDFGANVVPLAELDIKSAYAPVAILLLPAAGRNVQVKTEKQGLVMVEGAQQMEDGVALETGDYAVSVVELVYKNAFEPALIPLPPVVGHSVQGPVQNQGLVIMEAVLLTVAGVTLENGASVVKLVEVEPRCVQERAPILDRHMEVNNALETARRSGSVTLVHVQYQMLMEGSLSGLRSPSVARPVVKERRLATANAPTHPHRDLERTAKDHIRRL